MAGLTAAVPPLPDGVMLHKHLLSTDGVELWGVCVDVNFGRLVFVDPLRGGDGDGWGRLVQPAYAGGVGHGRSPLRPFAAPLPQTVVFSVPGDLRLRLSLGDAAPSSHAPSGLRLGLLGSWRAVGGSGRRRLHGLRRCRRRR